MLVNRWLPRCKLSKPFNSYLDFIFKHLHSKSCFQSSARRSGRIKAVRNCCSKMVFLPPVPRTKLGSQALQVSKKGLGCMGMSFMYGPPKPESDMIELIRYAVDSGVTFLDTSDVYRPHTNEILIGKALKGGYREKVQIATKFGIGARDGKTDIRGDPEYVRAYCDGSLKRLDVEYIDLFYAHRIDTHVPIEVTLVEEGKVKYIGLSEASASTIRRAHAVHPITAVPLEWSLWSRDFEEEILPTSRTTIV